MNYLLPLFLFLFFLQEQQTFAKSYDLEVKKQNVFITGKAIEAITINDQIPGPTLYFKEGEDVEIRVKNSMDEKTSIHWHGILLDGKMDGVPGLNGFEDIAANETFTYKFKIRQSGTYWYHSHSNFQEQRGMYGAIVIAPKKIEKNKISHWEVSRREAKHSTTMGENKINKDYVIILSDFIEENPETILKNLKIDSGYYNYHKRTIFTFFDDVKKNGFSSTLDDYLNWGQMRMDPTDLTDVSNYHFLINGKTNDDLISSCLGGVSSCAAQQKDGGSYFIFKKGERIKLRFINASAMTIFDVSISGLKMKFIEADGQPIKPVMADEFRIGVAETYDVIVEPKEEKTYTIFAESLDRTGYAKATLAPKEGMIAEVPPMRPRTILIMADMKMDGMDMSGMRSGWADASTPLGNKALKYSDLVSFAPQKDLRQPTREIEFHFGGNMNRYVWTINGEKFPKPIHLKFGERVRLKFINDTMMAHPIHLHGMFMQMETYSPSLSRNCKTELCNAATSSLNREDSQSMKWLPNKHTVLVPPAQTISMLLTADEEGEWAFHCHLLYHMASGMMTSLTVDKKAK